MENMALQRLQRHDRETRMELIFHHLGRRRSAVAASSFIKLPGAMSELMLPYIFAHIIGVAVPAGLPAIGSCLNWPGPERQNRSDREGHSCFIFFLSR